MGADDEHAIARIIGGLEAKVEGFQTNWVEQDRRATEGRRFLFEKMDGVAKEVQHLTHTVADVVEDVSEMKPAVADWVATKNKAIGASGAARLMWTLLGGVGVAAVWIFAHFLTIVPHVG
jgi:hypothetical protein